MKPIKIILPLVLSAIFIFSFINLYKSIHPEEVLTAPTGALTGFAPEVEANPKIIELREKIEGGLDDCKAKIGTLSTWNVIVNFLITLISGLSTLFTTLSTIRFGTATKQTAILVALMTFVSTMLSFGQSQLNGKKDDAESRQKRIVNIKNTFETLKPEEMETQIPLLKNQLEDEL